MTIRLGKGDEPINGPSRGEVLFAALAAQLEPLDVGRQLEIGAALTEGQQWARLPAWMRELFNDAAARLRP